MAIDYALMPSLNAVSSSCRKIGLYPIGEYRVALISSRSQNKRWIDRADDLSTKPKRDWETEAKAVKAFFTWGKLKGMAIRQDLNG